MVGTVRLDVQQAVKRGRANGAEKPIRYAMCVEVPVFFFSNFGNVVFSFRWCAFGCLLSVRVNVIRVRP